MKITLVAGARPNFIKIAPLIKALNVAIDAGKNLSYRLVHTGQHYDKNLSHTFFEQLGIPFPDINFEVKSGTQAHQTAAIMLAFEKELRKNRCDLVIVVGDVTSTMACAIVTKKEGIKLAHIEAGIRSGDLSMPEEINRIVTDSLSDYFFTTTKLANENLRRLGVDPTKIFFVGNIMIDTLLEQESNFIKPTLVNELGLEPKQYFVMTLHRPSNVDENKKFKQIIEAVVENSKGLPIVFPVHPRTLKSFKSFSDKPSNLHLVDPLSYLEFNYLVKNSLAVITDSGGITEETTVMGVPCFTLRNTTERPETCEVGTNVLVGDDPEKLREHFLNLYAGRWRKGQIPELWDGHTA